MTFLHMFEILTGFIFTLIMLMYSYQALYVLISVIRRKVKPLPETKERNRFGIFISARNEAGVIYELLDSLHKLDYPKDCYDIYVVADNCTDNTAEVAAEHGATVYERFNKEQVGKGYALNYLYQKVIREKGHDYYNAYVVFDADNIVDPSFLKELNKKWATHKYEAVTTYRNSKNFDTNWLSAAYSMWFMHEARHLNYVRDLIGAQCFISGTGFAVSEKVMKENNGWPFYFMTEDIQFSVDCTLKGYHIGYCDSAELFDEQPTTMKQSWNQRLRWAKGFFQIDMKYLGDLAHGVHTSKGARNMAFYDVLMTCIPCTLVIVALVGMALYALFASIFMPYYVRLLFQKEMMDFLISTVWGTWSGMMGLGAITVISEWKRIPSDTWGKIRYIWMFPMYTISYLPITVHALFAKVEWKPIQHYSTAQLSQQGKSLNF